ncbi:NitT/TauT family transport system substrate-binding protein [Roseibium hamelinense]|uniref:NitT/TauT family transport system substrate-binding protein n=2 Tax=Roseibium hamelinense TaxID=150831 RepID=A0A562SMF7_9HYPH|nr:NitT/TauT family transport system substrate-binding protein [Roseibium hamelinense]
MGTLRWYKPCPFFQAGLAQTVYSIEAMKSFGLIEAGEAFEKGVGCMTDAMITAAVVEAGIDISEVYTAEFVSKGVSMPLKN